MKILMYGDLHFQDKGTHEVQFNGQTLPAKGINGECLATCFWIAALIRTVKPNVVVNMGDLIESAGQLDMYTLYSMMEGIHAVDDACTGVGGKHIILVGNHDQADFDGKYHVCKIFAGRIQVVDGIDLHLDMAFISYRRNPELIQTMVQSARDVGSNYLFLHTDIKGARLRGSTLARDGMDADFVEAKAIFVGHHHHPQIIGTRTHCIGSCMYHDYRDSVVDAPRGVVIFDTETGEHERVANPYTSVFWNVDVKTEADLALIPQRPEGFQGRLNLRLRTATELLEQVKGVASQWPGVQIVPISHDSIVPRVQIDPKDSPLEVLEKHIDSEAPEDLDNDTLKNLGKEVFVP